MEALLVQVFWLAWLSASERKKGETYIDFVTLYDFGPWAMFGLFCKSLFHPAHRNELILAARGR